MQANRYTRGDGSAGGFTLRPRDRRAHAQGRENAPPSVSITDETCADSFSCSGFPSLRFKDPAVEQDFLYSFREEAALSIPFVLTLSTVANVPPFVRFLLSHEEKYVFRDYLYCSLKLAIFLLSVCLLFYKKLQPSRARLLHDVFTIFNTIEVFLLPYLYPANRSFVVTNVVVFPYTICGPLVRVPFRVLFSVYLVCMILFEVIVLPVATMKAEGLDEAFLPFLMEAIGIVSTSRQIIMLGASARIGRILSFGMGMLGAFAYEDSCRKAFTTEKIVQDMIETRASILKQVENLERRVLGVSRTAVGTTGTAAGPSLFPSLFANPNSTALSFSPHI